MQFWIMACTARSFCRFFLNHKNTISNKRLHPVQKRAAHTFPCCSLPASTWSRNHNCIQISFLPSTIWADNSLSPLSSRNPMKICCSFLSKTFGSFLMCNSNTVRLALLLPSLMWPIKATWLLKFLLEECFHLSPLMIQFLYEFRTTLIVSLRIGSRMQAIHNLRLRSAFISPSFILPLCWYHSAWHHLTLLKTQKGKTCFRDSDYCHFTLLFLAKVNFVYKATSSIYYSYINILK